MERQDDDLDILHSSVQRLGHMGLTINSELESQNQYVKIT